MKRLAGWLVVSILVLVAIVAIWRFFPHDGAVATAPAQPQLPLAIVREGSVEESISLAGRVGAPAGTQTKLAFSVPGSVQSVAVRLGEHVEAGTPLAQLDSTSYALAAQQAQAEASAAIHGAALASIDRVSVKLRADEAELARQQRLFHAGIVALRDVQAAEAALAVDRADAASARVQVAQAQAQSRAAGWHAAGTDYDVSRTTLRAPIAGTVVAIFVQPGEMVDPSTAAVAIASDRQGLATLDVPVAELPRITPGDIAHLHSSGAQWEGRVDGIATAVDPATGLAVLSVSGVPQATPAGTPVDATVVVGQARGLVVPRDSVIEDPQTGAKLVFVQERAPDGTLHFTARKVTVDALDARLARVASGVRAGERVAAQGAIDLLAQPGTGD